MKICKICGNQLENYASFCTNCGSLVDDAQPQQPVEENNFYAQSEAVAEENLETVEEISAFDAATLYAKKIKTAFITSIISTSAMPVYLIVFVLCLILSLIPVVNIFVGIFRIIFDIVSIATGLVCGIMALVNTSKALKLPTVYEGSVDEELFKAYQSAQKKTNVAKILGIVGTVLWALFTAIYLLLFAIGIIVLIVLFFIYGAAIFSEIFYYF